MLVGSVRRLFVVVGTAILAFGAVIAAVPSSGAPAGHGGWHFAKPYSIPHISDVVDGVSCPTAKQCYAIRSTKVFSSSNPAGGKKTWHNKTIESTTDPNVQGEIQLTDISCVNTHECVVVDNAGHLLYSTHSSGGTKDWTKISLSDIEIEAVGCSSTGACAALDYNGGVFSAPHPSGPWARGDVTVGTGAGSEGAATCAGNGLCAITSDTTKIATIASPGGTKWHATKVRGGTWQGISCPTTRRCVAAGVGRKTGEVAVSKGAGSWKSSTLGPLFSPKVSCGSASACFITGDYASSHAAANKHAWNKVHVPTSASETALSCPDAKHCFIGTVGGDFLAGKR